MSGKKLRLAAVAALAFALPACSTAPSRNLDENFSFTPDHQDAATLCGNDKSCRPLTKGEIAEARKIFGDEINYSVIKVYKHPYYPTAPIKTLFGLSIFSSAESPNGNIYFRSMYTYKDDFSHDKKDLSVLLHELTHVWQKQKGVNLLFAAVSGYIKAGFDEDKTYKYDLDHSKRFSKLGIEQQGHIIEDYAELITRYDIEYGKSQLSDGDWLERHCEMIEKYEKKIGESLPVKPFPQCQNFEPDHFEPDF